MKNSTFLFLFIACSWTAQAQVTTYNNAARTDFYGIGGYSFLQGLVPEGVQTNPYVLSGPSPQNDFSYAVSAVGGITNRIGYISTGTTNTGISINFFGNNVRKFGCYVVAINTAETNATGDIISLTATTNLGNTVTQTGGQNNQFVGFNVTGDENEYIVSITATFQNPPSPAAYLTIHDSTVGDNSPQNVALNLDGVNDYVEIPSTVGNFNTNENFTVSAWVRPGLQTDLGAGDNDIIEKWSGTGGYPFVVRYFNQTAGGNAGKIAVGRYDGANSPNITSSVTINDGKWHHIAFVKNGTALTLYIDGVSAGTATDNCTGPTTNTSLLYIGRRGNGINHFKGDVDEVRITSVALTQAQIQNDMFCKLSSVTNLAAAYNFNEGVPNGTNVLLMQVNNLTGSNHGTLTNLAKTGNASNFVTGQVRYVKADAAGSNNGSSWANAYTSLQNALAVPTGSTCNDLIEVWVAKGTYKPHANNVETPFDIPSGYQVYGGFAGTEAGFNQRNPALVLTTNVTKLSGDLSGNDTPNFGNRSDNSNKVISIFNATGIILDGLDVSGATDSGLDIGSADLQISRCKLTDNQGIFGGGANISNSNILLSRCIITGNSAIYGGGLFLEVNTGTKNTRVLHCLITGNKAMTAGGGTLNKATPSGAVNNVIYTNCTIAGNAPEGMRNEGQQLGIVNLTLRNILMYGNGNGISNNNFGGSSPTSIMYSLVQGVTTGTGNLNGNTVNPNFINLPAFTAAPTTAGDFHVKWCSKVINAGINPTTGSNAGQLPLDLDRTPAPFEGTYDMGVYEYLGNPPSGVNNAAITSTITGNTYTGTGQQTITSTAKILPPAGTVLFNAPNSITLQPGFEARGMQPFKAQIGPNVTCAN